MENYSWTTSGGSTAGHDAEDRLTYWSRSTSGAGTINTQEWPINYGSSGLSFVGDWTTVDINGTTQSRSHNDVHELTAINSTNLARDAKGNLTRLAGDTVDRFAWDFDNRMSVCRCPDDEAGLGQPWNSSMGSVVVSGRPSWKSSRMISGSSIDRA